MEEDNGIFHTPHKSWKDVVLNEDHDIDFSYLNEYIRKLIGQTLGSEETSSQSNSEKGDANDSRPPAKLEYQLFEIIGCTIVKIPLPNGVTYEDVQIGVDYRELVVKIGEAISELIFLPKKAIPDSCKAYCQNNLIEVHIPQDPRRTYLNVPIITV